VQFLSGKTVLEEQARVLSRRDKLPQSPNIPGGKMLAYAVSGALVVASMVAATALLRAERA